MNKDVFVVVVVGNEGDDCEEIFEYLYLGSYNEVI